jgi:hypothetical protein
MPVGVENVEFQCGDECEKLPQSLYGAKHAPRPRNSGDCARTVIELANWPVDCGFANAG